MSIFSPEPDPKAYGNGKRYFLVTSDQLEQLIIKMSPDITRDVNRMEDLIREIVQTEREKAGLDKPEGKATLELNQEKKSDVQPDYVGKMRVAGRMYNVAAWVGEGAQFINLTFTKPL